MLPYPPVGGDSKSVLGGLRQTKKAPWRTSTRGGRRVQQSLFRPGFRCVERTRERDAPVGDCDEKFVSELGCESVLALPRRLRWQSDGRREQWGRHRPNSSTRHRLCGKLALRTRVEFIEY